MIYLDNHATTPCDPKVVESMQPFYSELYGNAASGHDFGQRAQLAVDLAKAQVSELINGGNGDLIFTSGATESNNLVILGLAKGTAGKENGKRKVVSIAIEHKSVLAPLAYLQRQGWEVEFLPIDKNGRIDLSQAEKVIATDCFLVSVQLANSEIGTIQPIGELAAIAHRHGAFIHTDASQLIGKVPIDVATLDVDFVSISAHKFYGPKGIGAIWIKEGLSPLIEPIFYGGGGDNGIRPGTLPVPLIVGFGAACDCCSAAAEREYDHLVALRNNFEEKLLEAIPGLSVNGATGSRLPNNSSLTFPVVEADMLLANLPDIIASTGSACESASIEPSNVLLSIGLSREQAFCTIRFGFGRFNTAEEIQLGCLQIISVHHHLAELLQ